MARPSAALRPEARVSARVHPARVATAAALAALVAHATAARLDLLAASPFPVGIDGYYYAVQLRALLEDGRLYYPASPLVFWLLAPFAALLGPVAGVKVGAALGTALAAIPAYLVGHRLTGARAPALLGAVLVSTSAQGAYLAAEFVKQGLGVTIALGFVAALGAATSRPTRARVAHAAGWLVAALLAHKTAAALALLAGAPVWLAARPPRPEGRPRPAAGLGVTVALAGLALVVLLGAVAPARFISDEDLRKVAGALRASPDWSLAVLDPAHGPTLRFRHEALAAGALALMFVAAAASSHVARAVGAATARARREGAAGTGAGVAGSAGWRRRLVLPRRRTDAGLPPLAWGLVAVALIAACPWLDTRDDDGLAMRLRLLAFAPLGPLGALAVHRALAAVPRAVRAAVPLAVAVALAALVTPATREGVVLTHPDLALAVARLEGRLPPGASVLTPDRKIAFMATWYARVPTRIQEPPRVRDAAWRLLPGAWIRPSLARALDAARAAPPPGTRPPADLHPTRRDGLVLVDEPTWRRVVASLPAAARGWPPR